MDSAMQWQPSTSPLPPTWEFRAKVSIFSLPIAAIFFCTHEPAAPMARILSAIFSQTKGTPRKIVGLAVHRRSLMEFAFRSYGLAKKIADEAGKDAAVMRFETMSIIRPAM